MRCSLCDSQKLTEWVYEDTRVWSAYCLKHPHKLIVVLKRHVMTPTDEELGHMMGVAMMLRPKAVWVRSDQNQHATVPDHAHLHEK